MKNSTFNKQLQELESEFSLSATGMSILFTVSVIGLVVGLAGWILNPSFFWNIPTYYYILITTTAAIIFGITSFFSVYVRHLRISLNQLKSNSLC